MDSRENFFQSSWDRCWRGLGVNTDGHQLMIRIIEAYNEPHRKYHNEEHLIDCLRLFAYHRHLANEPDEVEIALWFHDAIYDVKANDNEARSARWAVDELKQAGISKERISRVCNNIIATCHLSVLEKIDEQLVVDIDLSIFGASPAQFLEYERRIRDEYKWVEDYTFCRKRWEILAEFLFRSSLYNTIIFQQLFEKQARINLLNSLRNLSGY